MHTKKCGVQTACNVHDYQAAAGELLMCEREPSNAVGMYCGSKDFSDTDKVVTRLPQVIITCKH